jgi:hypothetical protein
MAGMKSQDNMNDSSIIPECLLEQTAFSSHWTQNATSTIRSGWRFAWAIYGVG